MAIRGAIGGGVVIEDEEEGAPRKGAKARFAKRLWRLMVSRGWNQSELARRAGIGRDSVSSYVRQRQFPEPANLEKIAQALGMTVDELMADDGEGGADAASRSMVEMRECRPGMSILKINKEVPSALAAKILALLLSVEIEDAHQS